MALTTKDVRESSIFHMLGLAYHWRLYRLANFYQVTPYQMEMWLKAMNITESSIRALKEPYIEDGVCYACIMAVEKDKVFCSDACADLALRKQRELNLICENGVVPVTHRKHTFYNVNTKQVERTHVTS